MNKFDQGWRELNPEEKVETAMDFLLTFAGMMLIFALVVAGGFLLCEYTTKKLELSEAPPPYICGKIGSMTFYC